MDNLHVSLATFQMVDFCYVHSLECTFVLEMLDPVMQRFSPCVFHQLYLIRLLRKKVAKNHHSVDGTNPAPPGNINLVNDGINCISTGAGFLPSTVPLVLGFSRFLCLFGMLKWPFQTFPQTNINPKYSPSQKETILAFQYIQFQVLLLLVSGSVVFGISCFMWCLNPPNTSWKCG